MVEAVMDGVSSFVPVVVSLHREARASLRQPDAVYCS